MAKKTFRVFGVHKTYAYFDVEADSKEEAIQIGNDEDGNNFIDDGEEWEVLDRAVEIENDNEEE